MLEHLKTMLVGLLAAHLAFGVIAAVIWTSYHYGEQVMLAIGVLALAGMIYGMGLAIRNRSRLVRDGDSGEGESC